MALNAGQVLNTDYSVLEDWQDFLQQSLNTVGLYVLVEAEQLVGVAILVFVRAPLVHAINRIEKQVVRCGFGGMAGNKGGCAVRFDLFEETFCFICTHLAAGQKDIKARNENFHTILENLRFAPSG